MKPITLDQDVIDQLSPGVRDLVLWLNEQGFETTDSGDGSNFEEGMECATPHPMVVIVVEPPTLVVPMADRLCMLLEERGISFKVPAHGCEDPPGEFTWPQIQGNYDPNDGMAFIILANVLSKDLEVTP
jgi:hypothetical protein